MVIRQRYFYALVAVLAAQQAAWAQPPGQSVERDYRSPDPRPIPVPPTRPQIGVALTDTGPASEKACSSSDCFAVAGFRFSGNRLFSSDQLAKVVGPLAASYDLPGLGGVAARVTRYYRDHGYIVALAWIPPQAPDDGVVEIRIQEGRYAKGPVQAAADGSKDAALARAQSVVAANLCQAGCQGQPVTKSALERSLLIAGDVTGREVHGQLMAGPDEGTSVLAISTTKPDRPWLTLGADNYGSDSLGRYEFKGALGFNSVLLWGDTVSAQAMTSDHTDFVNAAVQYSTPIGNGGLRAGIGAFYSDYVLGGQFAALQAHGRSQGINASLSQPLLRGVADTINAHLFVEYARLDDVLLANKNGRRHESARLGGDGTFQDDVLGSDAQSQWTLDYVLSNMTFDDVALDTGDTRGTAHKLVGHFSRAQALGGPFLVGMDVAGQYSFNNLDPYDKLSIAGPNGVRAYPVGEITGDEAAVGQFYLGWSIPAQNFPGVVSLQAFYDVGWAQLKNTPVVSQGNTVWIDGAGLQFTIARDNSYALSAFWAHTVSTQVSQTDGANSRVGISLNYAL